jgi:hypothetical protein
VTWMVAAGRHGIVAESAADVVGDGHPGMEIGKEDCRLQCRHRHRLWAVVVLSVVDTADTVRAVDGRSWPSLDVAVRAGYQDWVLVTVQCIVRCPYPAGSDRDSWVAEGSHPPAVIRYPLVDLCWWPLKDPETRMMPERTTTFVRASLFGIRGQCFVSCSGRKRTISSSRSRLAAQMTGRDLSWPSVGTFDQFSVEADLTLASLPRILICRTAFHLSR